MDRDELVYALRDARMDAINARNEDLAKYGLWPDNQWRPSAEHDVNAILAEIKAQGYVIVPREPTEEMREAGAEKLFGSSQDDWGDEAAVIYRAMLSAVEDQ